LNLQLAVHVYVLLILHSTGCRFNILSFQYREDWLLQFAAGIKTVLLVPVVPHGVLQLGSLDMVTRLY